MLSVVHTRGQVGTLQPVGRDLEFVYAPAWLSRADAFALSPRLPLREAPWQGEEVLVFFANLLPEGRLLDTLVQLRRLPRGNVYRLLEEFGRECAGAFDIVPQGTRPNAARVPGYESYTTKALARDLQRMRDHVPLLASHEDLRLSLAGAQNKIPVRYDQGELYLPTNGAASTHILKPALQPETMYPNSVVNEVFCLQLAAALGIVVPETIVLRDPEPMLLIARYAREIALSSAARSESSSRGPATWSMRTRASTSRSLPSNCSNGESVLTPRCSATRLSRRRLARTEWTPRTPATSRRPAARSQALTSSETPACQYSSSGA